MPPNYTVQNFQDELIELLSRTTGRRPPVLTSAPGEDHTQLPEPNRRSAQGKAFALGDRLLSLCC